MRNLRRLATSLVALALLVAFSSCEKQPVADDDLAEVSFNISNPSLNGDLQKKDSDPDYNFPICTNDVAAYVEFYLDGSTTVTRLNIVNVGVKTETEVLKLTSGSHFLTDFVVYNSSGTPIWAAPKEGSYYDLLWDLNKKGSLDTDTGEFYFTTNDFQKNKIEIEVLCYEAPNY